MERQAERFYAKASEKAEDVGVRRLLGDLAEEEKGHETLAAKLTGEILKPDVREAEDRKSTTVRQFRPDFVPGDPGGSGKSDGADHRTTNAGGGAFRFFSLPQTQAWTIGVRASF